MSVDREICVLVVLVVEKVVVLSFKAGESMVCESYVFCVCGHGS